MWSLQRKNLLKCQRCKLLENLHQNQQAFDQLDYLLYEVDKEHKQGNVGD